MDQATNMEIQLAEATLQEPALAQSGSNVLRRHIKENPKKAVLARHRYGPDAGGTGVSCGDLLYFRRYFYACLILPA